MSATMYGWLMVWPPPIGSGWSAYASDWNSGGMKRCRGGSRLNQSAPYRSAAALPGFKEIQPQVFAGLYPTEASAGTRAAFRERIMAATPLRRLCTPSPLCALACWAWAPWALAPTPSCGATPS